MPINANFKTMYPKLFQLGPNNTGTWGVNTTIVKYTFMYFIAIEHVVKKLQRNLSDYFVSSYVDDMFSYNDEDNRIDLRDIYVPIQWVQYKTTPAKVKVTSMETYLDLFNEVNVI